MASTYSRLRLARPRKGIPRAANSSEDHPIPTPSTNRPWESTSRLAACLATRTGLCWGKQQDPRPDADSRGERGHEGQRHQGIEPVGIGGDGDPSHRRHTGTANRGDPPSRRAPRTRASRTRTVGHRGHGLDHRRIGSGTDAQGVQADAHLLDPLTNRSGSIAERVAGPGSTLSDFCLLGRGKLGQPSRMDIDDSTRPLPLPPRGGNVSHAEPVRPGVLPAPGRISASRRWPRRAAGLPRRRAGWT